MGDLKFEEFGDIWIFLLTVPGLLFNMVLGLGKFIFISLPLTLWAFAQWLIPTLWDIPVILFKTARILFNSGYGLLKGVYNFFVTFDWSWNALNDFPSLPSHIKALLNLGGINQPFDYFAGSYGTAVKEFILPLRRSMNDLRDFIDFMPWPVFFALVLLLVFWVSRKSWRRPAGAGCVVLHWYLRPHGLGVSDLLADDPVDRPVCGLWYPAGHLHVRVRCG